MLTQRMNVICVWYTWYNYLTIIDLEIYSVKIGIIDMEIQENIYFHIKKFV